MKININLAIILISLLIVVLPTLRVIVLKKHQKALKITAVIMAVVYFILLFIGTTFKFKIIDDYVFVGADFSKEWF